TDFVVSAAREAAEEAIKGHAMIELSLDDQQRFAAALIDPQPVAPALRKAISDSKDLFESS
ncbi:MAG: hypothetical protein COA78_33320, partial [Blastopirellula sp.]